jgi:acyl carrier protein
MDEVHIYERLKGIVPDVFDMETAELNPELRIEDIDGWDSLSHVRLILTIEKAFKIKFLTSEMGNLQNIGDLVAAIKSRL